MSSFCLWWAAQATLETFDHKPLLKKYAGKERRRSFFGTRIGRSQPGEGLLQVEGIAAGLFIQAARAVWDVGQRNLSTPEQSRGRDHDDQFHARRVVHPFGGPDSHAHRILATRLSQPGSVGDVRPWEVKTATCPASLFCETPYHPAVPRCIVRDSCPVRTKPPSSTPVQASFNSTTCNDRDTFLRINNANNWN